MEMEYDDDSVILVTGEEHRSKGNKFYGQGNYKAALECYTAAIDTEPNVASFYNNRSAVLIMLSRYQEAFNDSKKSCELDPSNTKALIRLGKCHMLLGCWNEAESVLQRVLEIEPSNNEARANLEKLAQCKSSFEQYRAQKDKQDFRHALFCIERCLEISPGSTELEIARIELWIYLKRYTEVKNNLEVIIKDQSNQTNIEAIYCRGLYFYYLDHIDKALTHFQHVLKSCPDHTGCQQAYRRAKRLTALKEQGNTLVKTCNYEQAREIYTSALELDPLHDDINAKLHCNRALTLIKTERYEEALSDCDRAVRLDPQYLKARSRRVTCFIGLERFDEAVREAEQLQKSHPADEHLRLVKEARLALKRSKQFNPYSVLGVSKGATDSEIKKAYRKRALQHHPDRHSHADEAMRRAEEVKFKEVNNAYSVLSDARKRQMYDSGVDIDEVLGNCGGGGASSSFHGDPMEVFQAFFNSSGGNTGFRFSTSFNH